LEKIRRTLQENRFAEFKNEFLTNIRRNIK